MTLLSFWNTRRRDGTTKCLPVEIRGKEYKILLMHDNVSFHLGAAVSTVCVSVMKMEPFCLPENATALCQPLDVAINKPVKSGLKRRMMNYLVDSYTDGEIRIPKNMLITWIQEVWKNDIINEIIRNLFKSCGLGVSPVDSSQQIYWKELESLQQHFQRLQTSLPTISELTRFLFTDNLPSNQRHPEIMLYTSPALGGRVVFE